MSTPSVATSTIAPGRGHELGLHPGELVVGDRGRVLQADAGDAAAGDRHGAAEAGEVEGSPPLVDPWGGGHLVHDEVDDVGVEAATGDPDVTGETAVLDDQVGQLDGLEPDIRDPPRDLAGAA